MRPIFDERDEEIRRKRLELWNQNSGPRVGDFCLMPNGGVRRFTYELIGLQITCADGDCGSFYLGNGYMSYSGGLDPQVPIDCLTDTGEMRDGRCWFFHHGFAEAHNGVETTVPCRVYRYEPKD